MQPPTKISFIGIGRFGASRALQYTLYLDRRVISESQAADLITDQQPRLICGGLALVPQARRRSTWVGLRAHKQRMQGKRYLARQRSSESRMRLFGVVNIASKHDEGCSSVSSFAFRRKG